jgi:hypothetical protein
MVKRFLIFFLGVFIMPAFAQLQLSPQAPVSPKPPVTAKPAQPTTPPADTPFNDEVVIAPPAKKITNITAIFTGLDKVTGRIITFDVAINETVQFGALQITPRVCYTRPPTEAPLTTSFVEVHEQTLQNDVRKIFSGWVFAASPGLSGVEHAVYDVWLADCKNTPVVLQGAKR